MTALYVVDRSADRASLPNEKLVYAGSRFMEGLTVVRSIYDLSEIDPFTGVALTCCFDCVFCLPRCDGAYRTRTVG